MSVPVGKRTESKCQAVYNATIIKSEIHDLCIRNLGIKNLDMIVRKKYFYGADSYEQKEKYVLELYQAKQTLHLYSDMLLANTRTANRVRMNTIQHCLQRIDYQEKSLDNCEMIIGKFQDVVDTFWVDVNKYKRCIELLDYEVALIKKWIKYSESVKEKLMG